MMNNLTNPQKTIRIRKSVFRRVVLPVIFMILFVAGFWFVYNDSMFHVDSVSVTSDKGISEKYISESYAISDYKGIHVFHFPKTAIERTISKDPRIESVKVFNRGLKSAVIHVTSVQPSAAIAKSWGYYLIQPDGSFVYTLPPYHQNNLPLVFLNDSLLKNYPVPLKNLKLDKPVYPGSLLFDEFGQPRKEPWSILLEQEEVSDDKILYTLGYRDLMILRESIEKEGGFPEVKYIGYDQDYGIVLKCEKTPLILLGYGNSLNKSFEKARRILNDSNYKDLHNEQKYIDIRFQQHISSKKLANLPDLFY